MRRLITLLVSAAILTFYFRQVEWRDFGRALLKADLRLFLPARLFQVLLYLAIDVYLLQRIVIWFHRPIDYSKVLYGRASLYIFSLINPQVANGGMFLYMMSKARISAEKFLGLILFRFAWSVWSINFGLTLGLGGIFLLGLGFRSPFATKLIVAGVASVWLTMIACLSVIYYLRRFKPGLKHRPFWTPFLQAKIRHYLVISGFTLLSSVSAVLSNYLCALSFGLKIPFHELMIFLPVVDIISTLPIAFAGLGTTTFAWETMYKPYGSPDLFLSFTIAFPIITYLMRTVLALIALPRATQEIQEAFSRKLPEISESSP